MTVIAMSRAEIDRMSVLRDLAEDRIRVSEAARLMELGRRQVFRLAKAYRQHGPAALVSRRRGTQVTGPTRQPCAGRSLVLSASATLTLGRRLRPRSSPSSTAFILPARQSGNGWWQPGCGRIGSSG
jgi:hypothetical protein